MTYHESIIVDIILQPATNGWNWKDFDYGRVTEIKELRLHIFICIYHIVLQISVYELFSISCINLISERPCILLATLKPGETHASVVVFFCQQVHALWGFGQNFKDVKKWPNSLRRVTPSGEKQVSHYSHRHKNFLLRCAVFQDVQRLLFEI